MHRDMAPLRKLKPGDKFKLPHRGQGYDTVIQAFPSNDGGWWIVKFIGSLFPTGMIECGRPGLQVFVIKGRGRLPNNLKAQCSSRVLSAFAGAAPR